MQRQHIRAEQHADTDAAKPLDAFSQGGMLCLGGIQVGKHHHGQAPPGRLTQQPKRQGDGKPAMAEPKTAKGRRSLALPQTCWTRCGLTAPVRRPSG
jgi:hypothetical protein